MATLVVYNYCEVTINGARYVAGSLQKPQTVTVTLAFEQVFSVATATTQKVFDVTQDLADFDFLWIQSDQNIFLEIVTDDGNEVGEVASTVPVSGSGTANEYGFPFILPRDDAKANYTVNFAAGTDDVIETLRIRNESGSTANIRVLAFT